MILVWFREIEARVVLLVWFVLQFIFNRGGDVAWMAHVAGFAFGVAVAWLHAAPTEAGGPSARRSVEPDRRAGTASPYR